MRWEYQPEYKTVVPETRIAFVRKRNALRHIIFLRGPERIHDDVCRLFRSICRRPYFPASGAHAHGGF
jgi:hypothetical protein